MEGWLITPGYRPRAAGQPDDRSIIPHDGDAHGSRGVVSRDTGDVSSRERLQPTLPGIPSGPDGTYWIHTSRWRVWNGSCHGYIKRL